MKVGIRDAMKVSIKEYVNGIIDGLASSFQLGVFLGKVSVDVVNVSTFFDCILS